MERLLRKEQDTLMSTGLGVIAFGVWSLIKGFFYYTLKPETLTESQGYGELGSLEKGVVLGLIAFVFVADLLLRIYIGKAAIDESKGKKRGNLYIIVTIFITVALIASGVYGLMVFDDIDLFEFLISMFVEITNLVISIEMIVSAFKLRKIRKEMEG